MKRNRYPFAALSIATATMVACAVDTEEREEVVGESVLAATSNHWMWNGESANVWLGDELGGTSLGVWEDEGKSGKQSYRNAYVWYNSYQNDPSSLTCQDQTWCWWDDVLQQEVCETQSWCWYTRFTYEYGWGSVDPKDFSVNGAKARLAATLTAGENFFIERCTVDYLDPWQQWTCTSNQGGGAVDLSWDKDGRYSNFNAGVSKYSAGKYGYRSTGTYRSSSATVNGNLFGTAVVDGYGDMGEGHNVSKDTYVEPAPPPLPL